MKKSIKKLCLLSIILMIISMIVINLAGKTYTIYFKLNNINHYELKLENETRGIEVIDEREEKNKYIVKVKAKKPGKNYIYLNYGENFKEGKILYVHKNMIITDNNYFGKSTYSEIIPISFSIILIYTLYLLIKTYKQNIKVNLYQYKNIFYLGTIIFMTFLTFNNIISIFNYQGLYDTIINLIKTISTIAALLFPIALITSIQVTISNISLIRKEGKSLKNLLGLFLGIFICLLTILPNYIYNLLMKVQIVDIYNLNSIGPYIYNFIETLDYLTITYIECILIGTIILAIKSVKKKPTYNKDYMIILGCQIKKDGTLTPLLKGRVDKAIEFRNKQLKITKKDLIFIPSGGKGNDETISEAEAMKNYLIKQGIKEKNILLEDKSKNTYENIKLSNNLIKDKNSNISFSTTNYHILRAGLIATEQGIKMEGIGAKTKAYFWINAFIREFIGTLYSEKKKHLIVFTITVIIIALMVTITYLANNI